MTKLAERGSALYDDFAVRVQSHLNTPDFMKGKPKIPVSEVENSREISNIRIHIEQVIGVLRTRYHILDGPLQLRLVKSIKEEANESNIAVIEK